MKTIILSGRTRLIVFFIILCFAGAFLLQIPAAYKDNKAVPFIDALFTSVSAVCVTGLSTVDMAVYSRLGFIIIMFLIELGGLGIITFISIFTAFPSRKVSLVNRWVVREFSIDDVENNPRHIVKNILRYTLTIQFIGFLCLMPILKSYGIKTFIFDSLFLAVSAFCNAGFSVYSDSLMRFGNSIALNTVMISLIILGGIGFIVLQNVLQTIHKRKKHLSMHTKMVLLSTGFLIVLGTIVFISTEFSKAFVDLPAHKKISAAIFQAVTPRTCGFETIPQVQLSHASRLFTILLMFIGGSPASIAGGIKTTTFFTALLYSLRGDEKTGTVVFFKRTIDAETINKSIIIIVKSVLIVFLALLFLSVTEATRLTNSEIDIMDLLFETVSAFGTVGLSLGITADLSFWGKIIIILTMFTGRTALASMMLVLPGTLKKRQFVEYPEEAVLIG